MKKIQTKTPNPIFSVSTLQKICVSKKVPLMFTLPTHCKLSTRNVEGIFGHLKVCRSLELLGFPMCCQGKEK